MVVDVRMWWRHCAGSIDGFHKSRFDNNKILNVIEMPIYGLKCGQLWIVVWIKIITSGALNVVCRIKFYSLTYSKLLFLTHILILLYSLLAVGIHCQVFLLITLMMVDHGLIRCCSCCRLFFLHYVSGASCTAVPGFRWELNVLLFSCFFFLFIWWRFCWAFRNTYYLDIILLQSVHL